jgi:choline dehydrogenase-like flavoprotein
MIRDLNETDRRDLSYDIAVVGSGPAGITLANELSGSGLSVAVLESGRRDYCAYGDRLRRVVSDGITIKPWSRERVLGGDPQSGSLQP